MNDIGPLIQQEDVGPFQQPVQNFPSFLRPEVEADASFVYVSQQEQAAAFLVGNTARAWTVAPAPSSANTLPQNGAEMKLPHSTTRTPCNAPSITYIRPHIEAAAGISGHRQMRWQVQLNADWCQAGFQLGLINRTVQFIHVLVRRTKELDTIIGRLSTGVKGVPYRIIHSCPGIVDKSLSTPIAQPVKYCLLCYGLRKTVSC